MANRPFVQPVFGALLVGWLVVVARGLYLARHLFTLLIILINDSNNNDKCRKAIFCRCFIVQPTCATFSNVPVWYAVRPCRLSGCVCSLIFMPGCLCDGVLMSVCLFMCLSFLPPNILPLFHTLTTGGYFRPVMVHSTTAFMFRQEFHTWGRKENNCLCCDCVTATLLESKYRERIHITNFSSHHTWFFHLERE